MFRPTTLKEVRARGWDQLDVILFTGDAYIDHPSFGAAASGTITGADPAAVTAVATGAATHFRAADSTGAAVLDGDVTATGGGGALQIASTSLSPGVTVDITALSFTMPLG